MFGSSPKILLYLTRSSLTLYYLGQTPEQYLEFSPAEINHLEIQNNELFEKVIYEYLATFNLKNKQLLLLVADDSLFMKDLPLDRIEDLEQARLNFYQKVPLAKAIQANLEVESEGQLWLFSTNREVYQAILISVAELDGRINLVSPSFILGNYPTDHFLDDNMVQDILSETKTLKSANFLDQNHHLQASNLEAPEKKSQSSVIFTIFLFVLLIAVVAGCSYFFYQFRQGKITTKPAPSTAALETATVQKVEVSTSSAAVVSTDKLTAQVLNGSGVVGLASKIKTNLATLGLTQIETGNAPETAPQTTVIFSSKVSEKVKNDVITLLKKDFPQVSSSIAPAATTDIVITAGQS